MRQQDMRNDNRENASKDTRQDIRQERDDKYMQDDRPIQNVKEIVRGFIGRNVNIVIRGKKTLSGKLESVSNYELLITVKNEPVLIMKHAVDYIELVTKPS